MTMKPPPPMLPALGCVTLSARPTATAASTALPPFFRMEIPTAVACFSALVTAPPRPVATSVPAVAGAAPTSSGPVIGSAPASPAAVAGAVGAAGAGCDLPSCEDELLQAAKQASRSQPNRGYARRIGRSVAQRARALVAVRGRSCYLARANVSG